MNLTAQFVTDAGIDSALIRYGTNGEYSHVDLVLPDGSLLGARSKGGVEIRQQGYRKFTRIARVRVTAPDIASAYDFAYAQIGKPYNYKAIFDMLLHRTRPFTMDQSKWFCSELTYAIVFAGGVELLNTADPISITPQELFLSPLWRTA